VFADARVLLQLLRGMPRNLDPVARLESFYAPQAASYDRFRERLLHGRSELIVELKLPPRARLIEFGAGTGSNLDLLGSRVCEFDSIELVDLCPSLLERARERSIHFPNVRVIAADACAYRPEAPADCVIFSYSLSMIPDWRRALGNAFDILRPGGQLAVADFMPPSAKYPVSRAFWRNWFGHDGVRLDDAHVSSLRQLFPLHRFVVGSAPVPYLPGLKVPYYRFLGTKS